MINHLNIKPLIFFIVFTSLGSCATAPKTKSNPNAGSSETAAISHPIGGSRDKHGCLTAAGYTWSEVVQDCIRLFEEGIRTEAIDGSNRSAYIVFSSDSLKAELFFSDKEKSEILLRRTLSTGEQAWNKEDDDTKVLGFQNGCWTISQRGIPIFCQPKSNNDTSLGQWEELRYEGILTTSDYPRTNYQLAIYHRTHSGDGKFHLTLTYPSPNDGKDKTVSYTGSRFTQRGTPPDKDATVWQLISDDKKNIFNFLCEDETQTLILLNDEFEKSKLTLKRSQQ